MKGGGGFNEEKADGPRRWRITRKVPWGERIRDKKKEVTETKRENSESASLVGRKGERKLGFDITRRQ